MRMFFVVLSFLIFSNSYAEAAGYGIVDIRKVILCVEEGKTARAKLEKEIKAKEKNFKSEKGIGQNEC